MLHLNIIRLNFKWLYMYQSKLFCIGQWKNSVIMSKPVLIKWIDKINFLVKIIFIIHYTEYEGVKNDKVHILVYNALHNMHDASIKIKTYEVHSSWIQIIDRPSKRPPGHIGVNRRQISWGWRTPPAAPTTV